MSDPQDLVDCPACDADDPNDNCEWCNGTGEVSESTHGYAQEDLRGDHDYESKYEK